ncbi:hypothetical protein ANCCEY_10104 [Ancylostoma ceylanicum]|uniref:Uncharacterized protein n=1 Tax=Ancylostoma ceylanicum TaxID=53326 RepID=A0A0D6LFH5_9BILA|nr:hypothetical protein ANCCEY_10104 [Ancylostoma ceylanicum]
MELSTDVKHREHRAEFNNVLRNIMVGNIGQEALLMRDVTDSELEEGRDERGPGRPGNIPTDDLYKFAEFPVDVLYQYQLVVKEIGINPKATGFVQALVSSHLEKICDSIRELDYL